MNEPEPEIVPNPNRLCCNPECVHARAQHTEGEFGSCRMCPCEGFHPVWFG